MYRHILVPTDGRTASRAAAAEAVDLAREHDARLTVLTVVRPRNTGDLDFVGQAGVEQGLAAAQRRRGRSRIADTVDPLSVGDRQIDTEVLAGVPHRVICEYANTTGVDLVVLGTVGRDSIASYVLGSTTKQLTELCDVPVLVV